MNQTTVKSLGSLALGAAVAVVAAGTASAAPAPVTQPVSDVLRSVPADALPAGSTEALAAGSYAMRGAGLPTVSLMKSGPSAAPAAEAGATRGAAPLLGGLPV
ncbi:ATP-binding protein [Streptomyces sp. ACA25]|uniref:ATP-binding protein n=1 Tax=Streptomyces sp. ACA25 TaxID=3022596 RepID=UPI002307FEF6|nr:ATP-binding protein [Streptomyces sp. ACA25]MDB1087050.1 ATP-binding protein [Streptomyces sp. ACA25]